MHYNKDKFEEQFSERSVFVEELIYENIKLTKENMGLVIENNQLKERIKELKGVNNALRISLLDDIGAMML